MASDDELFEAWRGGDGRAGKRLFKRHYDAVHRFFSNKVGDEAADLVQKTFLGCVEGLEGFRNDGGFRSWLFAIAYRQLCRHYRDRASEDKRFDFGMVTASDLGPSPSSVVARSEEERILLEALRQIPLDMQVALELHYWEQMSDAEIARALELPLGTVKSRIRRARLLLTKRITELSNSSEQLRTTLNNLGLWAARLRREALGEDEPGSSSP